VELRRLVLFEDRPKNPLSRGLALHLDLVELDEQGILCTGLTVRRQRPALALAELRADGADPRLLLEADLQRRRLYPRWIEWLDQTMRENPDVRYSDLFHLSFLPEISFDDLAVIARAIRPVGPGMMWSSIAATVVILALGLVLFNRNERTFVDVI